MDNLTLGSLFDGIGGFPLAAQRCGIKTLWASEIEQNCINITKRHFPDMLHLGDLTKINGAEIPPVDIISFGSPCQDLSVAGAQKGMKQICPECGEEFNITDDMSVCPSCGAEIEKTRSGLFVEAVRIIYEMRVSTNGEYPTFAIWENVPGAFNSNKGNDFRTVLEEITKSEIPMPTSGKWATAGMVRSRRGGASVAWRQLDAQFWGIPQRRKRIFLVADFRGERAAEILFKCESLLGYLKQSGTERERIAADIEDSVRTSSGVDTYGFHGQASVTQPLTLLKDKSPTLMASKDADVLQAEIKNIIFDDEGGSVMAVYENGICPTLRAQTHGHLPCVIESRPINDATIHGAANGFGIGENGDPSPTLTGRDRHGIIAAFVKGTRPHNKDEAQKWHYSETANTLNLFDVGNERASTLILEQHSFENNSHGGYKEGCGTLRASGGDYGGGSENLIVQIERVKLFIKYILRKLTPLECERLQGFPDNWTKYSYTGEEIKDTTRYVAAGNSLAVPCAERVFRGILAVLQY